MCLRDRFFLFSCTNTDSVSQLRGWGHLAVLKSLLLALSPHFAPSSSFYFFLHHIWKLNYKIYLLYSGKSPSVTGKEKI